MGTTVSPAENPRSAGGARRRGNNGDADSHACNQPEGDSVNDFQRAFGDELDEIPDEYTDPSRFVPGVGPFDADVVLVGEAPGAQEVEEGKPFVGQAGKQLDSALEAIGIDREEVYITNIVKVRPPDNRTPRAAEISAWGALLDAELARISPVVVVPLGATATRALLDIDEGITEVHGQQFERDGQTVVPTFHPAATFYDESKRGEMEADLRVAFELVEKQ